MKLQTNETGQVLEEAKFHQAFWNDSAARDNSQQAS